MKAWRIEKQKHLSTAKAGEGAKLVGGRWNSEGLALIYASENLSLAVLEIMVHAPHPGARRVERACSAISVADALIEEVLLKRLPKDFGPHTRQDVTKTIGDEWLTAGRSAALLVPSAIVPQERNLLLNPAHPKFADCIWSGFESIKLDARLWSMP